MDLLAHLARETSAFRAAVASAEPDATVPTCPDWTTIDLVAHLAGVQYFWGTIVRDRLISIESMQRPERPGTTAAVFDFFDEAAELLASSLAEVGDDVAVWTWAESAQHTGFVKRRQAHEALIHRLDAELAAGAPSELDAELATDGIDEVLTVMLGGLPAWAEVTGHGDVGEVAAVDTGSSWLVRSVRWSGTSPSGDTYADERALEVVTAGEPEWSIRGSASDLDCWFWNRPVLETIEHTGDTSAIAAIVSTGLQ